jgi:hypothetical protein
MHWLKLSRAAGVLASAVTAATLVGAQPANADITVDSAVCLSTATGSLTSTIPVIPAQGLPATVDWHSIISWQYCSAANGNLSLFLDNTALFKNISRPDSSTAVFERGTLRLHLQTSLGQKDLALLQIA